jgi:L-ribulose-5-phosphate 4-epimerase
MKEEGIKFHCHWIQAPPPDAELVRELDAWRDTLYSKQLIGVTPDGIGYGNVSIRYQHHFIISGTTTGRLPELGPEHYTTVTAYNFQENSLTTEGPIKASSESLSHAMLYECDASINAVFHVHHHALWKKLLAELPSTDNNVPYGSPEMAAAIARLFKSTALPVHKIFAMAGHQDGIVAFGSNLQEAGGILLGQLSAC